jgi:D-beta-D-heptose 7-phosphate kinase/D-beta-D-heptose 1-phosphate adenosyltransferase
MTSVLKNVLQNRENVKVLVAGDFMLDHYYYGQAGRISPEAPVPVVNITSEKDVPGGAANVVHNLCSLGCRVSALGIIGEDASGGVLAGKIKSAGADITFLRQTKGYATLVKSRVIGGRNHQLVRLDFNEGGDFPDIGGLLDEFEGAIENFDIAILSDYGKGFCGAETTKRFISLCRSLKIPVIVDPKGAAWSKYRGADYITPNFSEFAAVVSGEILNTDAGISAHIAEIAREYGIANVLVTRSELGMTLYEGKSGHISHYRAKVREVADVSGAGDTVVAALAAMLGGGAGLREAVDIANIAAGIAVGKSGAAVVTPAELAAALQASRQERVSAKILDWDQLFEKVAQWKQRGKTIAVANGCFDLLHRGHVSLLQAAAGFADKLIVAINSDDTVRRLKGPDRPINNEYDRAYVLAALQYVDAVVIFPQDTPEELLSHILPEVLVKGGEYTLEQVPGRQYAKRVELVEYLGGYSTTAMVNRSKGENG